MKRIILLSIPLIYLLFLLFAPEKALTQDLGRHIKTGEIILNCKCVPNTNLFSYTSSDFSFINHHWLSEVVFYSLSKINGIYSIIVFKIGIIFAAFLIVYSLSLKKAGTFWPFVFSIFYIFIFSRRFDSRPEIFSFLFISLFIFLIEKYRQKRNIKYLIFLPLIELLWTNMHIYFIVGIVFFSFLVFEELIKYKKKIDKKILLLFLLTILSTFINPNSLNGALIPFTIFNNYNYAIEENQNIFYLNIVLPNFQISIFEIISLFLFAGMIFNLKKINIFFFLVSIFCVFASTYMVRNFPIFVLATLPYISSLYYSMDKKAKDNSFSFLILLKSFIILILLIFLFFQIKQLGSFLHTPSYYLGPEKGADFFLNNNLKGPIFNNFDVGGYLIYRLYPKEKVFIDGRPEAYSTSFFNDYRRLQEDRKYFDIKSREYKFNTIFFAYLDMTPWVKRFLNDTISDKNWVMVYLDNWIVIFVRNSEENIDIINKFKINNLP